METNVITQSLTQFFDVLVEHRNKVFAGLVVVALGLVVFFAYRSYIHGVQVAAHQSFVLAMKEFEKPVKTGGTAGFATEEEKWHKVEENFRKGFEKHTSSTFAPMFLAYQATALVNLNKLNEAIVVMKKAVSLMKTPSLKSYYEVTLSLMQLDSVNTDDHAEGLKHLQKVADSKQTAQGLALYHLGLYAWVHKNFSDVKNYWGLFLKGFSALPGFENQITMVQERLDLLEA